MVLSPLFGQATKCIAVEKSAYAARWSRAAPAFPIICLRNAVCPSDL